MKTQSNTKENFTYKSHITLLNGMYKKEDMQKSRPDNELHESIERRGWRKNHKFDYYS